MAEFYINSSTIHTFLSKACLPFQDPERDDDNVEDSPGQGDLDVGSFKQRIAPGSQEEIEELKSKLLQNAYSKYHSAIATVITKEFAENFTKQNPLATNTTIHLQSVQSSFLCWERSDPRVSKEILSCKILPRTVSDCFTVQHSMTQGDEISRIIIPFSSVRGLKLTATSIELDVDILPKLEKRQSSSKSWKEFSLSSETSSNHHRIVFEFIPGKEPSCVDLHDKISKISTLEMAAREGLREEYTSVPCLKNPEEKFPILKDPTLVRAGQLACIQLLSELPEEVPRARFVVRMYSGIEEEFNRLLSERLQTKCENS